MVNSWICKAEDCAEYALCGRASLVKIKEITKQKFIKAKKAIASEMVKIRILVRQTFQTFLKLVLAEKWLTLIVIAVTMIQLVSIKDARYAFNVPNHYLTTQTKEYEHDKKYFLDKEKYLKNFEIVLEYFQVCQWNYCSMRKRKTFVIYY